MEGEGQPTSDNHGKHPRHVLSTKVSPCCSWATPPPPAREDRCWCDIRKWGWDETSVDSCCRWHYSGYLPWLYWFFKVQGRTGLTFYFLSGRGIFTNMDLDSRHDGFLESFKHAGPTMPSYCWGVVGGIHWDPKSTVAFQVGNSYSFLLSRFFFPPPPFSNQNTKAHIHLLF